MRRFTLSQKCEWYYFSEIEGAEWKHNFGPLPEIASQIFPRIHTEKLTIVNSNVLDAPMSFPDNRLIFLNTEDVKYQSQAIYQVGHELAHIYIASKLSSKNEPSMLWFEEVLCEISAHIFLDEYHQNVVWNSDFNTKNYSEYSNFMMSDEYIEQFTTRDLFNPQSEIFTYLLNNPYDREKNRHVANLLLPIFKEDKVLLWHFFYLAMDLRSASNFSDLLDRWADGKPEKQRNSIESIRQILLMN